MSMHARVLPFLLVAALLASVAASTGGQAASPASLDDLAWLAGTWTGSDGTSDWEHVYTGARGGHLVSAGKEFRGGRVVMIEFEHFYEREGALRLTPYPFGKPSVEFTLVELDAEQQRVVFENPEHDFPRRFTYARNGDRLTIELDGEQGGEALHIRLELERRSD